MTAIHPKIIAAVHPLKLGKCEIRRAGAESTWAQTSDLRVAFDPDPQQPRWWLNGRWFNVEAIAVPPASEGIDVLIGRDILSKLVMSWDGPRWKLLLMYESSLQSPCDDLEELAGPPGQGIDAFGVAGAEGSAGRRCSRSRAACPGR